RLAGRGRVLSPQGGGHVPRAGTEARLLRAGRGTLRALQPRQHRFDPHAPARGVRAGGAHPRRRDRLTVELRAGPGPAAVLVYALTGICRWTDIKGVDSVFEIIAEPNRRAILSLLVSSQQSVGEIERRLGMSQPTVSKHLRVLKDAGFVESTVDAQRRLYRLKPKPFQEMDAWLAPFREFWSAHLDALERHLDRIDQSAPAKRKTKKR